ncbi:MAG TPA: HAMP domain-containing sensor histidine kinase [Polyangiaceae bacterium]|nr:HAMP domain-containing sensor histidine kinase [Polyangiaceae bacterium]
MPSSSPPPSEQSLLPLLQELLDLPAISLDEALNGAALSVARWLQCDKVDAFLLDESRASLVAIGASDTPLGRRQRALGLDVLPLANGGRVVEVFLTGRSYWTGHADQDPHELPGIVGDLGVRSAIHVALVIEGQRRGVLSVVTLEPERFNETDLSIVEMISHWVGALAHRAELVQRLREEEAQRSRRAAAEEIVGVLSHDVRNHLAPLSSRLQLLKMRLTAGKPIAASDLDVALAAVGRLARLTNELLDLTRLDQGLFVLELAPVDLVPLLREVARVFSSPEVEVRLTAPDSLTMLGDAVRLRQALENVIANGVRHSPPERPLEVTVTEQRDPPQVRIDVVDQGPGIPPDLLSKLFERFVTSRRSKGLGLGLYLAERVAAAHGGSLSVNSTLGSGAQFTFLLPLEGESS